MPLTLHDTMAGEKRPFTPADPNRVTMYVCGPTVYSYAHIGNARPVVVFDLLYRALRHEYGEEAVVYARNITDIDDKIIKAAAESGKSIEEITQRFSRIYREDMAGLGALPPTIEPTATGHIGEMIALMEKLIAQDVAYVAEGHVLFAIDKYTGYGALSRVNHDEMIAGARVEVAPYKKNAADFVLWKPAKDDEPGWDSPWGCGRPGWHLECSAMIEKNFGPTIDIHGGGQDLRFPHHENEIAQSVCAHGGAPLARYWLHNGFLRMGADKMSKSLGNVVLAHDLLKAWPGEAIRWALLSAQYRQPLEWKEELLVQSKRQLDRFYRTLNELSDVEAAPVAPPESVLSALSDDLNTPDAFAALHQFREEVGNAPDDKRAEMKGALLAAGRLMGFFTANPSDWFKMGTGGGPAVEEIERLIADRTAARKSKDFARSDAIRDDLASRGVVIEDGPDGVSWRRR